MASLITKKLINLKFINPYFTGNPGGPGTPRRPGWPGKPISPLGPGPTGQFSFIAVQY